MIEAADFVDQARSAGFDWYAGVPCSFLTPFINYVIGDPDLTYISAANEGDAVAAAAGAAIGGRGGVAMMQNSGLGNAVSPLTSLTYVFRIPQLIICTHRGAPGVSDEPQHELMGQVTGSLFDTMAIPWTYFPQEAAEIAPALEKAHEHFEKEQRPYALLMKKGTVAPYPLTNRAPLPRTRASDIFGDTPAEHARATRPSRLQVLEQVIDCTSSENSVVLATTGFTGRELYAAADRANHLYMVGSMGCVSSLGLGLALARPDLKVVIIDGDGAGLMRMGNFATLGAYGPDNLTHVLLDNEAHDSTGAQATVSATVDFASVALACGYGRVQRTNELQQIAAALTAHRNGGPSFVHVKIGTGTIENLPRPSISPADVLARLKHQIN